MKTTSFRHPVSACATSCLALVCLILMALAPAAAQQSTYSGFEPNDEFQLEVDGTIDTKAQLFLQRRLPAFLVLPAGSNTPLLVSIRSRAVQSVSLMKMTLQPSGMMDLAADAITGSKGTLEQKQGEISFLVDGKHYELVEKPVFEGLASAKMLEDYGAGYLNGAASYEPDAESMAAIRAVKGKVQVRTYFGSWCPFCKRYVPGMVRVAKEIQESNITIDFYGLPKGISSDPVANQARVNSVPTGVVFLDGKEVGRLTQNDWTSPEKSIAKILKGQ